MDIFSRIFAIPSDVSSTEEDNNVAAVGAGNDGIRSGNGARMQKRGHSRTLTPLSLTDGNGTLTSQSYGEGTLSYGSVSEEEEEPLSPTSTSSDIEDHSYDVMEDNARPPSNTNNNNRGRQRSASEQPTSRFHDINKKKHHHHHHHHKTHRSSSTATSSRKSSNVTTGMQLQLNSPSKKQQHKGRSRHGSKSRGAATASGKTNNKDPTLTRVHSWSSGEEDDSNHERRQRRHSRSRRPTLELQQQQQKDGQRRSSSSNMSNQQRNGNHNAAASSSKSKKAPTASAATATTAVKKERNYWRTKLTGGMKKHLSPGMSSASTPSPQQQRQGRPSSAKTTKPASSAVYYTSRSSKKKSTARGDRPKQSSPDSKQMHNKNKNKNTTPSSSKKNKLNLPPSAITRKQPINVGDNIIISQQFLEESADMSVLTMPRELIAIAAEEEEAKAKKALDGMMEDEMMVLQDDGDENDDEDYYYEDCNNGDEFQPHRTVHKNDRMDHAYYDRWYNRRDYYSQQQHLQQQQQQQEEEGILSSTTAEQIGAYASRVIQQEGRMNKHIHAIHGTQHSIVHDIHIGDGAAGMSEVRPMMHQQQQHLGIVASMQPPPPPPPLPSQSYGMPTSRPPQNSNIPHWNTPATSGSNSESIGTSYDDPPGMLVTSPTLQLQPSASSFGNTTTNLEKNENDRNPTTTSPLLSATDPPGDPYRPFDEQTEFHPVPPQTTQGSSNNNKLRSNNNNKAVTFSLPPPTTTIATALSNGPPPAPPFMGPNFDYYYSMEKSNTNSQFNFSPSLRILPPIIELYSVVDGSDTTIPGGGNDDVVPVSSWDATRRKCALMGGEEEEEDSLPLIVAESWINVCDNNKKQEASDAAQSYHHHHLDTGPDDSEVEVSEKINAAASAAVAFAIDKESMTSSAWNKGDTPHDEHFNDILDCGESLLNHPADELAANDGNESQGVDSVIPRVNDRSTSSSDSLGPDEEDANVRHRSTWNAAAYKPPKLSSLDYDPSIHEQQLNNDQWQNTVRTRNQAAIILQKSIRGLLELSKLDRLIDATLVIQPVIRRYLSRKRYVEYVKLKRSYYPNRWRRNHVAVAL